MSPTPSVYDVFTPTTQAKLNFVPRNSVNDRLVDALRTPGKQVVVYGETGSGKSTLVQKKLQELYTDHITTRCSSVSTFESIVLDAFDQLGKFYTQNRKSAFTKGSKGSLGAEVLKIKASVESQAARTSEVGLARVVSPQLTVPRLAGFLGAEGMCWVLEDFHKVAPAEKANISQTFKVFSDMAGEHPEVKIVAIGATDTAREVVQYDREMANRVSEIPVPLMCDSELSAIIHNGGSLLEVSLAAVADEIVSLSSGLASICHNLCLHCCVSAGIYEPQLRPVLLGEAHLEEAVARYVEEASDTLKSIFEVALAAKGNRKFHDARLILAAIAAADTSGASRTEILRGIRARHPEYAGRDLSKILGELAGAKRGMVLSVGADGRYRFADPALRTYAQQLLLGRDRLMSARAGRYLTESLTRWVAIDSS